MSLFASQRVRSRIDDVNDRAHRAMNSASDAVDHARYAARPAVEDVQSLLRSLENAIHTLTDEGSAEASRARRTLHARADRGPSHAGQPGQFEHAHPRVLGQQPQQPHVQLVQCHD